jgi:2'-5' RNA ligase
MEQIAVDIVLLPSGEFMDIAIEINRELLKRYPDKIILDKETCLPHISLAMGCINKERIPDIERILCDIAKKHPLEKLNVIGFYTQVHSTGEKVTLAEIQKSKELQSLHEDVTISLAQYFSFDVTDDMLLSEEKVSQSSLLWIKNYPEKSSFERFSPHVTLGYGHLENHPVLRELTVSNLAMCHLGDHCTCRKILASTVI